MLTKTDLQAINKIVKKTVREEVSREGKTIRSEIRTEIKLLKMELSNRIAAVENRLSETEIKLTNIEKDIAQIKKDIKKIKKDLAYNVDFMDRDYLRLQKRVERVEEHLNLSPAAL